MKKRIVILLSLIIVLAFNGLARQANFKMLAKCAAFFKGGNKVTGIVNFMSTRHPKIGFLNQGKFNLRNVWMLNFMNNNWNYPNERKLLKRKSDTIFLKNGQAFYDTVITYSTKFKVFRFKHSRDIHVSKIKRIYFCCTILPKAYRDRNNFVDNEVINYTTFLVDGKVKNIDIKYYNRIKTGFVDDLQINTKDIVMINFENRKRNFPDEKKYLNYRLDTVFLNDGKYIQKKIAALDFEEGRIIFQNKSEISMRKVTRIYFKKQKDKLNSRNGNRRRVDRKRIKRENY